MGEPLVLSHSIDIVKEVDGIEMGVLKDGTAYLTGRGLARLCGVVPSAIIYQKDQWKAGHRTNKLAKTLVENGYNEPELFIADAEGAASSNPYSEAVCMTVLEYFAFEAQTKSPTAQKNFRTLARAGLRAFVYTALGYAGPSAPAISQDWKHFHDRMMLVNSPLGYFSVFKEIAEFVIGSIRGGLPVDESNVPDISVGLTWGKHWTESDLEATFGPRIKHPHNFPEYFKQAPSNPQEIWVYPVLALGEFRMWLQSTYIPEKFPKYLLGKEKKNILPASTAEILIEQSLPIEPRLPSGAPTA